MSGPASLVVLIAEPAPLFADLIASALTRAGHEPVAFDAAPPELSSRASELRPDILIVGPSFGRSGLDATIPELLAIGVRTILVAPNDLGRIEAQIMLAGASGYLSAATSDFADVAAEVARVASGSSPLHPDVVRAMLRQWRESRSAATVTEKIELTPREIDVVRGLSDGLTTRLIAARLGVSEKTIEAHKSRLFAKVGAKNSSQALKLVSARGLV